MAEAGEREGRDPDDADEEERSSWTTWMDNIHLPHVQGQVLEAKRNRRAGQRAGIDNAMHRMRLKKGVRRE